MTPIRNPIGYPIASPIALWNPPVPARPDPDTFITPLGITRALGLHLAEGGGS